MGVVRLFGGTLFYAKEDVLSAKEKDCAVIFKKGRLYFVHASEKHPELMEVASELAPNHLWSPQEFPEALTENVYVAISSEAQVDALTDLRGLYSDLLPLPSTVDIDYLNVNIERFRSKNMSDKGEGVVELTWMEFTRAMIVLTQNLPRYFVEPRGKVSLSIPATEVEDLEPPVLKITGEVEVFESYVEKPGFIEPTNSNIEFLAPGVPNPQEHYTNDHGSLYKIAMQRGWDAYQFDAIKRIDRAYKKGKFSEDLQKTKDLIDLWEFEAQETEGFNDKFNNK